MLPLAIQLPLLLAVAQGPGLDGAAPGGEADILVTASRVDEPPAGATSIVTREEIERFQPASLLEPLNDMAGVRAISTGGPAGRSFLSVRGGEPNFTLVLVDGIRLNDPTNSRGGGFDFFALDPALIERIEVARGAGSAVHGSDALSGVVNLRLRDALGGDAAGVRAQAGSDGRFGASASLAGGWTGGGALASASLFDSGGLAAGSTLERRQGLVTVRQQVGAFAARFTGLYGEAERAAFPEDSGGPRLAVSRQLERGRSTLAAAGLTLRAPRAAALRPNLALSWSRQRDRSDTPAIAPGQLSGTPAIASDSRFTRFEAIADAGFRVGAVAGAVGLAWLEENGRSDGTIDLGFPLPAGFALDRTTRSAFAEAVLFEEGPLSVGGAIRYDDVKHGRGRLTRRLRAAWRPGRGDLAFFAAAAEGYKLPSFYALAHPLIGNPLLRPERSLNLEAGVERGPWRLTMFQNRYRDLIDFDPVLFTTVNRDRVRARGIEAEGRWQAHPALTLAGAASFVDLDSPTPLRGRPRWQGSLRAGWRASQALELSAALRANSGFFDSSIPTGLVREGGHIEADLAIAFRMSQRLTLRATATNVTGSRHEDAVGFPARGPSLRATLAAGLF